MATATTTRNIRTQTENKMVFACLQKRQIRTIWRNAYKPDLLIYAFSQHQCLMVPTKTYIIMNVLYTAAHNEITHIHTSRDALWNPAGSCLVY